jgi:simple sugar transport system ATP-binding protein
MSIELRHIHKRFGPVHANNDITLSFDRGRIIGVLGENGAGKTTLMKILSGYQPADSGDIVIDGAVVAYDSPRTAIGYGIGMLQQDPLDVGAFTVLENYTFGLPARFLPDWKKAEAEIEAINAQFGFNLDPHMPVENLSIAQRQQLEIARLLALGVRTLILDEPTTGISVEQKETLFGALRGLARNQGMIVLLVSHKLEDVIALCDEIFVLRGGVLVGQREMPATPSELVAMMFGEPLAPAERESVEIGGPVLSLKNAHLRSKRLDMPDVSIDIRAGEVIGLAGLDGSGQELFMRACAGLESVHGGSLTVKGRPMSGRPYRQFMQQGVVFSAAGRIEEGLIAGLTLTEHMALVMNTGAMVDWRAARVLMAQQIERYDVRGRVTDTIERLSGGNQQRVLMSLLPNLPTVLLLEQPTRGLDVESARWIWSQLLERRGTGTAIVFSSAELDEIVTYSDRILVFYAGQIREVPDASATSVEALGHLIGGNFEWMPD